MDRQNIVIYFEQYSWGGTDTHLENLILGWPNKDDHFTILYNKENIGMNRISESLLKRGSVDMKIFSSLSREGFILKFKHPKLIRLVSLLTFPIFWLFWGLQFLQAFFLLKAETKISSFISNNGGYPGGWGCNFAMIASKILGIKKRVLLIHHQATPYRRSLKSLEKFLDNCFFKYSTDVVAVSEATKSTIIEHRNFPGSMDIKVIYNGITIESSTSKKVDDLREKSRSGDRKLVGIMGVIERYKGHEDLIKAINKLDDDVLATFKFLIIGKGGVEEVSYLKSIMEKESVKDAICFTGYVEGDSQAIISQLDMMLVLTKDFEGFGLTLAEAMSVNVPIMATKVGAIPEFVFHNENGYLINPNTPEDVASGLVNFISDQESWKARAVKAKETIKQYSKERLGSEFQTLVSTREVYE